MISIRYNIYDEIIIDNVKIGIMIANSIVLLEKDINLKNKTLEVLSEQGYIFLQRK